MAQGGDLVSVFIMRGGDNDTRNFAVASGGDNSRILGGRHTEEVETNGDGSVRDIVRVKAGEREVVLNVDDANKDQEWILEASRAKAFSVVTYTHVNGSVYSHKAKPVGDLSKNDGNSTLSVTFKGTEIKSDV